MNALSASFGQTCCVMCILVVPFLLFFVMCLFGLAGSGFLGWGGAVVGLSAFLHEKKKSMILIVVTGLVGFSILMSAFLIGMPYPPIDLPPAILKVQQQPILGNWQN
jgi:hypothetical protein